MCGTCPWRENSPYAYLKESLQGTLMGCSRVCHSTGSNAINYRTGKPAALCRGARNDQLRMMHSLGIIAAPTDEAWSEAWQQLQSKINENQQTRSKRGARA